MFSKMANLAPQPQEEGILIPVPGDEKRMDERSLAKNPYT